jgi:hypothetical protein
MQLYLARTRRTSLFWGCQQWELANISFVDTCLSIRMSPCNRSRTTKWFFIKFDTLLAACFILMSHLLYCLTLKKVASCSSESSVDFKGTAQRYIPEDRNFHSHRCGNLKFEIYFKSSDRLCCLVVRVSGYRCRGPGFDSRRYQIFWEVVGLERGPLSLVRIIEELLKGKSSGSGLENWD